jgi:hypothetical protein
MAKFTITYADPHQDTEEVTAKTLTEREESISFSDDAGVLFWVGKAAVLKVRRD